MSQEKSKTMPMCLCTYGGIKRCIMAFVQVENLKTAVQHEIHVSLHPSPKNKLAKRYCRVLRAACRPTRRRTQ